MRTFLVEVGRLPSLSGECPGVSVMCNPGRDPRAGKYEPKLHDGWLLVFWNPRSWRLPIQWRFDPGTYYDPSA